MKTRKVLTLTLVLSLALLGASAPVAARGARTPVPPRPAVHRGAGGGVGGRAVGGAGLGAVLTVLSVQALASGTVSGARARLGRRAVVVNFSATGAEAVSVGWARRWS